ncbi:MAG: hypothetical protein Q4E46_02370 [Candidatus Saccharibacteria bacterium]|nr:hypothetical protein [Candidatus Saccharibacteria bacterium]
MTKKILAFTVVMLLAVSLFSVTAFAFSQGNNVTIYEGVYTTVLTLPNNHAGQNVRIDVYNNSIGFVNDVKMLDRYGNQVWQENGAISNSGSRTFWCGSDVSQIQVRVTRTSIFAYYIGTCTCDVYF